MHKRAEIALLADQPCWAYDRIARGIAPWLEREGLVCRIGYCSPGGLDEAVALAKKADLILSFGFPIFTKLGYFRERADRLLLGVWDSAYLDDSETCERLMKARATVCFNRAIYACALDRGVTNAILLTPAVGVDPNFFRPSGRPNTDGRLRIGFVGNLARPNKRLDLIDALMKTAPAGADFLFTDQPGTAHQRLLTDESLRQFYSLLDVLLCVSDFEGGPLPPIEAAACGVPSVATPVGILPEFIEHGVNGLLVNGNAHELRSALARLRHEEGLLASLKQSARERALVWRWEMVARSYAYTLGACLSQHSVASCVESSAPSV